MSMTVAPVPRPVQFDKPQLHISLIEVTRLIDAETGRSQFDVDGRGLTVAVLDTGINVEHVDFAGRIVEGFNATPDNGGTPSDTRDGHGHGTHVTGIVCAHGLHRGIAPGASVAAVKVLLNSGAGSFEGIERGLRWVVDNHRRLGISVVCMSLGDGENYHSDVPHLDAPTTKLIKQLHDARVAVVVAAGNDYARHRSQGMGYPAIVRQAVSVGAVFDANVGRVDYPAIGAIAFRTAEDVVTPFSQRLHPSVAPDCATDILAPGAHVTSSGIQGPRGTSTHDGTSQATPVVAGTLLLMQQLYRKHTNALPAVDELIEWLRHGAVSVIDGDNEDDNVPNTGKEFLRIHVPGALAAVVQHFRARMLSTGRPLAELAWSGAVEAASDS